MRYQLGEAGYLKIKSAVLGESIFLVRDSSIAVPESGLVCYTLQEIRKLRGLDQEEVKYLHFAKKTLEGVIV